MKKQHILSICITGALLTACGSGGSSGTAPTNSKLPYKHEVPKELKEAVKNALKIPVNWNPAPDNKHSATFGDKVYNKGDIINLTDFDLGLTKTNYSESNGKRYTFKGKAKVYRQHYSAIMAFFPTEIKHASKTIQKDTNKIVTLSIPFGYWTENMPDTGKATYKGKSFYRTEEGDLNLAVNFSDKKISGNINGLSTGKVTLEETDIGKTVDLGKKRLWGYNGSASLPNNKKFTANIATTDKKGITTIADKDYTPNKYHFRYEGAFLGPKAEETGGIIFAQPKPGNHNQDASNTNILNFAGQRGEIKK